NRPGCQASPHGSANLHQCPAYRRVGRFPCAGRHGQARSAAGVLRGAMTAPVNQSLRVGLVQMTSGSDMAANVAAAEAMIRDAREQGAALILTPEATSLLAYDREFLRASVRPEAEDPALSRFRDLAAELGVWLVIGSLPLEDGAKIANRSFVIAPDGRIAARYDKLHLFDVELGEGRSYRESATY